MSNNKLDINKFQVDADKGSNLSKRPTKLEDLYRDEAEYKELLSSSRDQLKALQQLLYADNRYAALIIFQGLDTAGKDGIIRHVMSGINPQGCQVFGFKAPSEEELDHDYLWRAVKCLPERGRIGIFNRSYYEEMIVVRVHPELLDRQRLPEIKDKGGEAFWKERAKQIRDFESYLMQNGVEVIKFYLHLSKAEQRQRLLSRLEDPEKNWKFQPTDMKERGFWEQYMSAFDDCLSRTSSESAPWYVVPADDKKNARLIVAQVIVERLSKLKLNYPKVSAEMREHLNVYKALLEGEKNS